MTKDATKENTNLKRELSRFRNRFFSTKARTKENLALFYFLLEDFLNAVEASLAETGNELLETDFKVEYFPEYDVKVYLDEDCGVLIDTISKEEQFALLMERNNTMREKQEFANGMTKEV